MGARRWDSDPLTCKGSGAMGPSPACNQELHKYLVSALLVCGTQTNTTNTINSYNPGGGSE